MGRAGRTPRAGGPSRDCCPTHRWDKRRPAPTRPISAGDVPPIHWSRGMGRYLDTFARHRLLLLAPLLLALFASLGFVMAQPRTYESSARILIYGSSLDVAPGGRPYSYLTAD